MALYRFFKFNMTELTMISYRLLRILYMVLIKHAGAFVKPKLNLLIQTSGVADIVFSHRIVLCHLV